MTSINISDGLLQNSLVLKTKVTIPTEKAMLSDLADSFWEIAIRFAFPQTPKLENWEQIWNRRTKPDL